MVIAGKGKSRKTFAWMHPIDEEKVIFLFYLFATILIASSSGVILSRNPMHAVLFLILAFFNASGLFILAEAEFLAFLLVIVYVGAVAVLFLFIVMMLDINFRELRQGITRYAPFALIVAVIFAVELFLVAQQWSQLRPITPVIKLKGTNTHQLGQLLYTHYFFIFQLAGLVLLVAMIGAIVLTLRKRSDVHRQKHSHQVARTSDNTLKICKVPFRKGILP